MIIESAFFRLPMALSSFDHLSNLPAADAGRSSEDEAETSASLIRQYEGTIAGIFTSVLVQELDSWHIVGSAGRIEAEKGYRIGKSKGKGPDYRVDLYLNLKGIVPFNDALQDYGLREKNWIEVKLDPSIDSNFQGALWALLSDIAKLGQWITDPRDARYVLLVTRSNLKNFRGRKLWKARKAGTGIIEDLAQAILGRKGNTIGPVHLDDSFETEKNREWLKNECGAFSNMTIAGKCWEFASVSNRVPRWNGYLLGLESVSPGDVTGARSAQKPSNPPEPPRPTPPPASPPALPTV